MLRPMLSLALSGTILLTAGAAALAQRAPVRADTRIPASTSKKTDPRAADAAGEKTVLVKADSLTIRDKPSTNGKKVDTLTTAEILTVRKRDGEWVEIASSGGQSGWVMAKYLTPNPFVTAESEQLNIRRGPGTEYEVLMVVNRKHYPFRVIDRSEGWLLVSDYEGDLGWISAKLISFEPFVITREPQCRVRAGAGVNHPVAFTTEKGVLLRVLEEKDGWLRVRHQDGDEGWISAKIVFGWLDTGLPPKAKVLQERQAAPSAAPKPPASPKPAASDSSSGKKAPPTPKPAPKPKPKS